MQLGSDVSSRILSSRAAQIRGGPYSAIDAVLRVQRVELGKDRAPQILLALTDELDQPLRRHLAIERGNRGGAPGQIYRNYAIDILLQLYQQASGNAPTSTPGGAFIRLTEAALIFLKLPTEGVEAAVARRMKRFGITRPTPKRYR